MVPLAIALMAAVLCLIFWRKMYDVIRGREIYDDLYLFNTKLTEMVKLELPLDEGIRQILSDVFESATYKMSRIRKPLIRVAERISNGKTLGDALDWERGYFPNYYVSMIRIGESENKLMSSLLTLNAYLKMKRDYSSSLFSIAGFYLVTTVIMFSVAVFISVYVMPTFITLFSSMGIDITIITMNQSVSKLLPIAAAGALVLVVGYFILKRSKEFNRRFDLIMVKIPVVGNLIRIYEYMVFSRVMSKLLENWIPLDNALILSSGASDNFVYSEAVKNSANSIDLSLVESLKRAKVFDDSFIYMVSLGEKTENLAETFSEMADYYAESYRENVKQTMRFAELGTTVLVGLFTGFFSISMFYPMFELINQMVKNIVVY